ncbi:MAG TPA: hypothetical protein PKO44_05775 [Candidatus Omnitrophota bacterium]|nr:hypothetical protein [Candidatus Omnitrophota bacterium]
MKARRMIVLMILFLAPTLGFGNDLSVDDLQAQAFANIKRAQQVVMYAQKIMEVAPTRQGAEQCVELYLEAAQLYGHASRLLKAIGPSYVPQEVVDEFAKGERSCLKVVEELRRVLNRGEVVGKEKDAFMAFLKMMKEMSK